MTQGLTQTGKSESEVKEKTTAANSCAAKASLSVSKALVHRKKCYYIYIHDPSQTRAGLIEGVIVGDLFKGWFALVRWFQNALEV